MSIADGGRRVDEEEAEIHRGLESLLKKREAIPAAFIPDSPAVSYSGSDGAVS